MFNTPLFLGGEESGSTGLTHFNFNYSFAIFFLCEGYLQRDFKGIIFNAETLFCAYFNL